MIFLTADTHADIEHFTTKETKNIKKGDTVIVLGDFGFVWDNSKAELKILKKLSKLPFKILFLDGTRDSIKTINSYPDTVYNNANAKEIIKNKIYYIKRGEILEIEGKKLFCFGGYDNNDIDFSIEDFSPKYPEFEKAVANLKNHELKVDYILTHGPSSAIDLFLNLSDVQPGNTAIFLDEVNKKVQYKKWFFGWYHLDKYVSPKVQGVYKNFYFLSDEN